MVALQPLAPAPRQPEVRHRSLQLPSAILLLLLQQFLVQLVRLSLCLILHLLLLGLLADTPGADLSPVSDPDLIRRWDTVPAV
jgi:hypothetical protein